MFSTYFAERAFAQDFDEVEIRIFHRLRLGWCACQGLGRRVIDSEILEIMNVVAESMNVAVHLLRALFEWMPSPSRWEPVLRRIRLPPD